MSEVEYKVMKDLAHRRVNPDGSTTNWVSVEDE